MIEYPNMLIERTMLQMFSGGYNYRRFVRDRTRNFLYYIVDKKWYFDDDMDEEAFANRVSALMHGFCAGYVTGVDDKYDENVTDVDVADELFDVMAFAQKGIHRKYIPPCVLPRAYAFLVTSINPRESIEDRGALVGAYMHGLMAGMSDVKDNKLDDLFCDGGIYFAEQEAAKARIRESLDVFRDVDINSEWQVVLPLQGLCRVIERVVYGIDGAKLFKDAVTITCDTVEERLERALLGRSGFDVRNNHYRVEAQSVIMAKFMLDEMLKNLVDSSGFDPQAVDQVMRSDVGAQIAFVSKVEAQTFDLTDYWQELAAYYAGAFMRAKTDGHEYVEGMDPMVFVMTEAIGATLGHLNVGKLGCKLSHEETEKIVRMVSGGFGV